MCYCLRLFTFWVGLLGLFGDFIWGIFRKCHAGLYGVLFSFTFFNIVVSLLHAYLYTYIVEWSLGHSCDCVRSLLFPSHFLFCGSPAAFQHGGLADSYISLSLSESFGGDNSLENCDRHLPMCAVILVSCQFFSLHFQKISIFFIEILN